MVRYELSRSNLSSKKYKIQTPDGKTIQFGQAGASDYTLHKDPERRDRYIARHQSRENWTNLDKAGTWSRYILWNQPTLEASIRDMEKRFGIKIIKL